MTESLKIFRKGGEKWKRKIFIWIMRRRRTRPEVVEAMLPYFTELYGNPSSVYDFSAPCKQAVAKAREIIAKSIGAKPSEIYFTAGGSESDNWALEATADA